MFSGCRDNVIQGVVIKWIIMEGFRGVDLVALRGVEGVVVEHGQVFHVLCFGSRIQSGGIMSSL